MNILFTICARAGSKGLKSKNILNFCGEPIVNFTLAAYQLFLNTYKPEYENILLAVNTDSTELIEQINKTSLDYIYIEREENLAGDNIAKIDVIKDTLLKSESVNNIKYDIVIDLDLTSPLRTVEDIKGTLDSLLSCKESDISFSVTESRRSPYFNMVCEKENGYFDKVIEAEYVCRQQVPICYDMNASIYAYRREYLLSKRKGNRKAVIWQMEDTAVLDIDCEADLKLMETIASYLFSLGNYKALREEIKKLY